MVERRRKVTDVWFENTGPIVAKALRTYANRGTLDQVLAFFADNLRHLAELAKSREPEHWGLRRDGNLAPHLRSASSVMEAAVANVPGLVARYYHAIGVEEGTRIEGSIKAEIYGESYNLTSFKYDASSPRPVDRIWVHTHARTVGPVMEYCRDLFQMATETNLDFERSFLAVATFLWWFFHAFPFVRGTEAIGYWLLHYAFGTRSEATLRFDENPAALAWVCPNPQTYAVQLSASLRTMPPWSTAVTPADRMLCYAARRGDLREVRRFLRGVPADTTEPTGYTPLQLAAREGHGGIVKILLKAGANPNAHHVDSDTRAIHIASRTGDADIVKQLHRAGAEVNTADASGSTPLHWAVRAGHLKVINLLLKLGADVNAEDEHFRSPTHYACHKGDTPVVKALLKKGRASPDLNLLDEHQESPLSLAATAGRTAVVCLLLKRGAKAPTQDTLLTALSAGDEQATGLMREERMNPGLYRLFLRVAQQGHEATAAVLRERLLQSLRRAARKRGAEVLAQAPRRARMPSAKGLDTGEGLTYIIREPDPGAIASDPQE